MTWELLIPVILKYGIPWAYDLWKVLSKYPTPTDEAWAELLKLSQKTMDEYIKEAEANK